jgi:glycosyltransferase involved in cell wall biosynthesis
LFLKSLIGRTKKKIWFSSYYSIPPFRWDGYQIVFVHDFIHERFSNLFPDSEQQIKRKREAILKADAIICNSKTTANDLQNYYSTPEEKIFISELGVDHNFKRLSDDLITKKVDFPFILYLGKRKYYKGFDTLLSAFSSWKKNESIKLITVGPSWSKEEESFIVNNNLENKIILLSNVDDNELCDLYNQAKAFVYPSLYEGFGIPLLEAMACGCPIIASRIPSTLEVAQEIPIYFNTGDVDELINALNEVEENGRYSLKVKNGLTLVSQYSWENTARKILDVFNLFLN